MTAVALALHIFGAVVRDLSLSAASARHARAATEILPLGVVGNPVAASQWLLDAVHDLRGLCRGQPVHPHDADDRLIDDRAVRTVLWFAHMLSGRMRLEQVNA